MMLRISNMYYLTFSVLLLYLMFMNSIIQIKIDSTLSLINEELILDCVSYKGLIDSIEEDDESYLYINQELLKKTIEDIIYSNLKYVDYEIQYYFYDYSNKMANENYCNSVQIKFTFNYQKKCYEKVLRFEPIKEGD